MNDQAVLSDLLQRWRIPLPRTIRPTDAGTNNLSWRIESAGGAYILRIYQNTGDPGRIFDEHTLLRRLQEAGLSFAVPTPVPNLAGETLIPLPEQSPPRQGAKDAWAALFPLIPGRHAQAGNVDEVRAAGAALGELDAALAAIPLDLMASAPPTYGDLEHIHPLAPDPLGLLDSLGLDDRQRESIHHLWVTTHAALPALYGALPRQVIHSDFGRSNMLVADGRVSGILDFEFAAPDLRAMDVAIGLYHCACTVAGGRFAVRWDLVEAFAAAYATRVSLTAAEVEALPALLRLRRLVALIHRIGRWKQGLADTPAVYEHLEDTLRLHEWLTTHDGELVASVRAALTAA